MIEVASASNTTCSMLDPLIAALIRLRDNHGTSKLAADELWPVCDEKPGKDGYIGSRVSFDNGMADLQQLKDAKATLTILSESLDNKILALKSKLVPASLHHGMAALPGELLARILLQAMVDVRGCVWHESPKILATLSSVSKCFHDVVRSQPRFWVYVSSSSYSRRYQNLAERITLSKNAPLLVDIEGYPRDFMLQVLPHKKRWATLKLAAYELQDLVRLTKKHPGIEFPSVASLNIFFPVDHAGDPGGRLLFSEWTFPNVQSLHLCGTVSLPGCFSKLTKCVLGTFQAIPQVNNHYLRKAILFLQHTPHLEVLNIDMSYISAAAGLSEHIVAELPCLVSFTVKTTDLDLDETDDVGLLPCPVKIIGKLVQALRMPNVETIALAICFRGSRDAVQWVHSIFPITQKYPAVRNLSIRAECYMNEFTKHDTLPIDELFMRFPALESFSVEASGCQFDLPVSALQIQLAHLRTLFVAGFAMHSYDVDRLLTSLQDAGITLEEMKVASELFIDLQGLQSSFPNTKILAQGYHSRTIPMS